jgi:hypothetical protein
MVMPRSLHTACMKQQQQQLVLEMALLPWSDKASRHSLRAQTWDCLGKSDLRRPDLTCASSASGVLLSSENWIWAVARGTSCLAR